ncbi:MAG: hypothetical protein ABSG41_12540 [Bryobacteraceae bacterium]
MATVLQPDSRMEQGVRIAVQSANLVHELSAELSNPERANELVWRFRTTYHPQLAALWQDASLMPGITQQSFLPASVEILRVEGLQSDSKPVYAMSEITEDNVQILVRDVIEKLRWLAQYSLTMRR